MIKAPIYRSLEGGMFRSALMKKVMYKARFWVSSEHIVPIV